MADDSHLSGGAVRAHEALDRALRDEPGRVLSVLVRSLGDIDLAEEALQDAATAALDRWPVDGVPANPGGWLVTVGRRRAIDRLRRTAVGRRKEAASAAAVALAGDGDHLFHATRADLLRRLDRPAEAEAAYRTALTLTTNEAERRHLERRIGEGGRDRPGSDGAAGYLT